MFMGLPVIQLHASMRGMTGKPRHPIKGMIVKQTIELDYLHMEKGYKMILLIGCAALSALLLILVGVALIRAGDCQTMFGYD